MKYLFLLLLVFGLAVIQTSFFPNNLIILLLFIIGIKLDSDFVLLVAFSAGILVDLVGKNSLGLSSLIYVLSESGLIIYRNKFSSEHLLSLAISFLIFYSMIIFFSGRHFYFIEYFIYLLIVILSGYVKLTPRIRI